MYVGFNGSGFFENLDDNTKQLIKNLDEVYIRVPGGAISRFHSPFTVIQGWGLTKNAVNYFFDNYEVDYEEDDPNGGRDKWLQKVDEQPDYSYLDSLISLSKEMPNLRVIYVVNVFTSNLDEQVNSINYLIENGVKLDVVEFGNEVYGKYNFDTTSYVNFCQPVINKLKELHPSLKVSLISGNFKGRRDHEQWNESLAAYVNNPANKVDYVTLHFYIGSDLAPSAYNALPAAKVVDYSKIDQDLQTACENYLQEVIISERFREEVSMAESIYNTKIIVTEWNNNPAQKWCNTFVNGMWIYDSYINLRDTSVDILCLHNGVSPDIYGAICRRKQQDDSPLEMVPRVSYHVLDLVSRLYKEIKGGAEVLSIDHEDEFIQIPDKVGTYVVPFMSVYQEMPAVVFDWTVHEVTSIEEIGLDAEYLYSSAGATGFQSKNQPKNMDVKGLYYKIYNPEENDSVTIPATAIGYYLIKTEKKDTVPIANAGEPRKFVYKAGAGAAITLDGSDSYDPDGTIVSAAWLLAGTTKVYDGLIATTELLPEGSYEFILTVVDNKGNSTSDNVVHTVKKRKGFFNFNFKSSERVSKIPKA